MSTAEKHELACVYAALLLHDDGVEINADRINKVLAASGHTDAPAYYPEFFAKYLSTVDLKAFLNNVGVGGGASAPAESAKPASPKKDDKAGAKGKDAGKKKEPSPKKKVEEEEGEGFGGLFD